VTARQIKSDDGDTLVEVLVGIAIISIVFVGVLAGMGVTIASSTEHKGLADSQALVRNAVEQIQHETFDGCAGVGATPEYSVAATAGYHLDIATVAVWDAHDNQYHTGGDMDSRCATTTLQKLQVRACTDDIVSGSACPSAGSETLVTTRRADS